MIVVGNILQVLILIAIIMLYKKFGEFEALKQENVNICMEASAYKKELDKYKAKAEELNMQVFHLTENINANGGW